MPSRIDADGQGEAVHDETQRGLLGRIGSRIGKVRGPVPAALQTREALLLLRNYEESGRGWFWSTDAEGRLTYISEAVAALMGRSGGELLGTVFTDLFQPADGQDERQRSLPFLPMRQSKFDELRSEEHTSELKSLMSSSYAVFCLKKTINN